MAASPSWLFLLALLAANLPFISPRLMGLGPRRPAPRLAWQLGELLLWAAVVIGLGFFWEARLGQRAPQGWAFYAAMACLFATLAFPGFVWAHLRRNAGER